MKWMADIIGRKKLSLLLILDLWLGLCRLELQNTLTGKTQKLINTWVMHVSGRTQ